MITSNKVCKDVSSKSNCDDYVCEMNDMLHNMSMADNEDSISICANCGKEGSDVNNICNKCKMVKYCNAACKKKHRSKHKKECEEYIRRAAKLHDIELFKQPPSQYGDCPICFLLLPSLKTGRRYQGCCGKMICSGCINAPLYDNQGNTVDNKKCPFCRTPHPETYEEMMKREKKLVDLDNPIAIYNLGVYHRDGERGYPQHYTKALEFWNRAGELGHSKAYGAIGYAYDVGRGVEIDKKKANHYYELSAMGGDSVARHHLGKIEEKEGNFDRALKHYMIAVRGGISQSLEIIKEFYSNGQASKEDYTKALQFYQAYLGEIKSRQRDKAAAAREDYRYY